MCSRLDRVPSARQRLKSQPPKSWPFIFFMFLYFSASLLLLSLLLFLLLLLSSSSWSSFCPLQGFLHRSSCQLCRIQHWERMASPHFFQLLDTGKKRARTRVSATVTGIIAPSTCLDFTAGGISWSYHSINDYSPGKWPCGTGTLHWIERNRQPLVGCFKKKNISDPISSNWAQSDRNWLKSNRSKCLTARPTVAADVTQALHPQHHHQEEEEEEDEEEEHLE